MSILNKLFGTKASITSDSIRAEIERAESEITSINAKISQARSGIALLTDAEHQAVEQNIAAMERSVRRLDARIAHLTEELPNVIASEEAASRAAADADLVRRAKAATKMNTIEAKAALEQYGQLASAIVEVITKLKAVADETAAVNAALRSNPIAEAVRSYQDLYRKALDTPATSQTAMVPHWIYRDASVQADESHPGETVTAVRATLDDAGKPVRPGEVRYGRFGGPITPTLEDREVVVSATKWRPGHSEAPLDSLQLPGAFAGDGYFWPRSS